MTSKGYRESTIYSISINEKPFELSYDDLVCLKYLLTTNGFGKRLQRPEYQGILSNDAKMAYSEIIKRYRAMIRNEKEVNSKMLLHNPHEAKLYYKRISKHYSNKRAKLFLLSQLCKIEEALNQAEKDRKVENNLNDLLNKLLPVE